jgi:hypothetical protein
MEARMNPAPARWPLALLEAALPAELADAVVGDLIEEFTQLSARDPRAARRRCTWAALRSLAPACALRLRRVDPRPPAAVLAAALLAGLAGAASMRALYAHVLHLVPLRAGHPPTPGWSSAIAASAAILAAWGGLAGLTLARRVLRRNVP